MVNYVNHVLLANQKRKKYFECIIIALMLVGPKTNNSNQTAG